MPGRRVWDLPTRLAHWLVALGVAGAWLSAQASLDAFTWHAVCGYAVLVLVAFRLVWGFAGTRHARFASFVRGPRAVWRYLRAPASAADQRRSVGHNPAGGWSVLALLATLLVAAASGLFANDAVSNVGPLFGWVSGAASDHLTHLHHVAFRALQALVGLHVAAIAYYRVVRRENLVRPMLTGRKPAADVPPDAEIGASRLALAATILAALCAALALLIRLAPPASLSVF